MHSQINMRCGYSLIPCQFIGIFISMCTFSPQLFGEITSMLANLVYYALFRNILTTNIQKVSDVQLYPKTLRYRKL